MRILTKSLATVSSIGLGMGLCLFLNGCEPKEGPAEKMGKAIDRSVDDVKEGAKDFREGVEDAADDLGSSSKE